MEKCIHGCNKTGCSGIIYMKRGESMQKNAPSGKLTTAERDASLDRCLSGIADEDPAALEELYRLTSAPVYGYALSFLKNAQDAEDDAARLLSQRVCLGQRDTIPAASRGLAVHDRPEPLPVAAAERGRTAVSPRRTGRTAMVTPRMPARTTGCCSSTA